MSIEIDFLLARLRDAPDDPALANVDAGTWSRIALLQRRPSAMAIWGWRTATAAMALAVGVLAGGVAATPPTHEHSLFSPHITLAPSTLLEGQR